MFQFFRLKWSLAVLAHVYMSMETNSMAWNLPKLLALEEIDKQIVRIEPIADDPGRPLWSVMIPTYNRPETLKETLESVLAQDPGPAEMQIQVSDNCSDVGDIEALVKRLGGGRVEYYRTPRPRSDNFNICIQRARGRWVHILHDDDIVLPGFYQAYRQIIESDPELVMVTGRVLLGDDHLRWHGLRGPLPEPGKTRLEDFPRRKAFAHVEDGAATVVRREAYEAVGGFCHAMSSYSSDWDMWFRVSLAGPVAGTHQPYAVRRVHAGGDNTARVLSGESVIDYYLRLQVNHARLVRAGYEVPGLDFRQLASDQARAVGWFYDNKGNQEARLTHAVLAWRFKPGWEPLKFLVRSWVKYRWNRIWRR
jgi:glycosyltransferase involved in cell wall biosynthesis